MKPLTDLIFRLHHKDTAIRYPEYAPDDGKTHLLYVGATLNGTSFYRIMLPAWTLNTTDTHCAIINDLRPWHNENRNICFSMPYWDDLIRWAHYIIFPTVISLNAEFRQLLMEFYRLNPKVRIVMDIDDDYLQPPRFHPNYSGFTPGFKDNLLKNHSSVDIITCTHQRLCDYYSDVLSSSSNRPRFTPKFYPLPNLMTVLTEPGQISPLFALKNDDEPLHLGLTVNRTQLADLLTLNSALKHLIKGHPDRFKITLFGWDGKLYQKGKFRDAFKGVPHQYIAPVLLQYYFATLQSLRYDIALMPLCDNNFNRMKSNHKLLQYAQMGVPAVAPNLLPYNEPAIPGRDTVPYTHINAYDGRISPHEYVEKILYLADNPKQRKSRGVQGQKTILDNYFIEDPKNIKIWQDTFS